MKLFSYNIFLKLIKYKKLKVLIIIFIKIFIYVSFLQFYIYIFQKIFKFNNFEFLIKVEIIKLRTYLNVLNDNNFL